MARLIKVSFQLDEQTLAEARAEAEERGELLSVIIREWTRAGRDDSRRRRAQSEAGQRPAKQTNESAA